MSTDGRPITWNSTCVALGSIGSRRTTSTNLLRALLHECSWTNAAAVADWWTVKGSCERKTSRRCVELAF